MLFLVAGNLACEQSQVASPEAVLTDYIHHLHAGNFAAAEANCTSAGIAYLAALQAIMTAVDETPDSNGIRIESMQCTVQTDTLASCTAVLDDSFETYPEAYQLRFRNNRWLVHHEPEAGETTTSEEPLE